MATATTGGRQVRVLKGEITPLKERIRESRQERKYAMIDNAEKGRSEEGMRKAGGD